MISRSPPRMIGRAASIALLPSGARPRSRLRDLTWRIGLGKDTATVDAVERSAPETFELTGVVDPRGGVLDSLPEGHFLRQDLYTAPSFLHARLEQVLLPRESKALAAFEFGLFEEFLIGGAHFPTSLLHANLDELPGGWTTRAGEWIERVSGVSIPFCHYGLDAFGHFVLDGLLQVYLHRTLLENGAKLVHWPFGHAWMSPLLTRCGVPPERRRVLRGAVALLQDVAASSALGAHGVYFPTSLSRDFFDWLRIALVGDRAPPVAAGRVYVRRGLRATRAVLNETDLEALLKVRGFTIIDPATTEIHDQAALIAGAELLMAPWGSGLTLAPLMGGRRQVVELTPDIVGDAWFLRQAAVHRLGYLPIVHTAQSDGAIVADLARIDALLAAL